MTFPFNSIQKSPEKMEGICGFILISDIFLSITAQNDNFPRALNLPFEWF